MLCGLLGQKLSHSYSPQIHKLLGSYSYELFEKEPEELKDFLTNGNFDGLNVTIPYKKAIIPYCSTLSEQAKKLGSVNTIVKQRDGTLIGHNTDYFGFYTMITSSGISVRDKKALILGSGGASNTVQCVLSELGAIPIIISRSGENNYNNLSNHKDAQIIVNATPVGMYPNNGNSPLSLDNFPKLIAVYDLIYNPCRTELLQQAEKRSLVAVNGLQMLVAQAKESAEWFTSSKMKDSVISDIYAKMKCQMENVVLIGMPGCGKSTIGKLLSVKLNRDFIDSDEEIIKIINMPIGKFISENGEAAFRKIETEVLREISKKSSIVIATGGGCVTQACNYPLLHQNSKIIWIERDISQLPTDGRPLSRQGSLQNLYTTRKPMYQSFSDFTVVNQTSAPNTVTQILSNLTMEGAL